MLVLTRKSGESVCISHDIEVKVLAIRGGTVRIGISAPPDVAIRREEIAGLPDEDSEKRLSPPVKVVLCSCGRP